MLGIEFVKLDPTVYVLHYRGGRLVREGPGLSVLYFAPVSTVAAVSLGTVDLPFAFQEATADFQTVTLQGQLSYRVAEPKRLASVLNYSVDGRGKHVSDDPEKLGERLLVEAQSAMRGLVQARGLRAVLTEVEALAAGGLAGLKASALIDAHGVEMLGLSLVSVRPTPETAKALEAGAREALLRESDEAIYARRKAAVEQERAIKETELDTERVVDERKRALREAQLGAEVTLERKRAALVEQRAANDKQATDSKAYAIERTLAPYRDVDWRLLMALGGEGGDGRFMMAAALERFADNAGKIGQLTITPELLSALSEKKGK